MTDQGKPTNWKWLYASFMLYCYTRGVQPIHVYDMYISSMLFDKYSTYIPQIAAQRHLLYSQDHISKQLTYLNTSPFVKLYQHYLDLYESSSLCMYLSICTINNFITVWDVTMCYRRLTLMFMTVVCLTLSRYACFL